LRRERRAARMTLTAKNFFSFFLLTFVFGFGIMAPVFQIAEEKIKIGNRAKGRTP
jgi:hypothetical protein